MASKHFSRHTHVRLCPKVVMGVEKAVYYVLMDLPSNYGTIVAFFTTSLHSDITHSIIDQHTSRAALTRYCCLDALVGRRRDEAEGRNLADFEESTELRRVCEVKLLCKSPRRYVEVGDAVLKDTEFGDTGNASLLCEDILAAKSMVIQPVWSKSRDMSEYRSMQARNTNRYWIDGLVLTEGSEGINV